MKRSSGQMPGSVEAAKLYQSQYQGSPAEEFLIARGLGEGEERFLPGYVGDSVKVGHENYRGSLVIPYLRPAGLKYISTIRFRCVRDDHVKDLDGTYFFLKGEKEQHGDYCSKYRSLPADHPRLYNTISMTESSSHIAIVEGEFSTWAVQLDGIPAVAVQGVSAWRESFVRAFKGYEKVFLLGDGDDAGQKMNDSLAQKLPNGVPIRLPDGEDADSLRRQYGDGSIRKLLGLED